MDYLLFSACLICSFWAGAAGVDFFRKRSIIARKVVDLLALRVCPCHISFVVVYLGLSRRETIKYFDLLRTLVYESDFDYWSQSSAMESLDDVLNKCFPEVK